MMEEPGPAGPASEAELALLSELDREALQNERLRAKLIAIFCGIGGSVFLFLHRFLSSYMELLRQHRGFGERVAAALWILLLYEIFLWVALGRRLAQNTPGLGRRWRFASAVLELTLPTVLVYSFIDLMHPIYGLLMPPTTLYFLFILLSALRMDFAVCAVTGSVAAVEYMLLYAYGVHRYSGPPPILLLSTPFHHVAKAVGFLVCGLIAGIVTSQLKQRVTRSLRLIAERNHVTTMFGLYVSPSVVEKLMEKRGGMDLGGELRDVCVLFLDIRNFTQFSEKRAPQEVVSYLNSLFSFMIDIVSEHGGIINKFLGDGFMAIFGAPLADGRECERAMRAALAMVARLDEEIQSGRLPATRIGIGIHYGPALTGSIGSPRRKEYTIIGDTVNLASRIEQLSKQYKAQILVSHSVLQAAKDSGIFAERIGEVSVRGRESPLELYRLA
jgi:adenylate cyclase